ncbi:hypothetical protein [Embleya sp. NPDC005575]|uniref:hypothetical protein n=1 Tax=Embleya sp. NPDC005575 TaxID=3156892 RepID=UPI0033BC5063
MSVPHAIPHHPAAPEIRAGHLSRTTHRGDRAVATTGLAALAVGQAHTGNLAAAEQSALRARDAAAPLHDFLRIGTAAWGPARILALRGRSDEAETILGELQQVIDEASTAPCVPGWSATRAQPALWRGAATEALRWCERERHAFTPDLLLTHTAALRLAGDAPAARLRLEQAEASPTLAAMPQLRSVALAERAHLTTPEDPTAAATLHRDALRIRLRHGLVLGCIDSLEALAAPAGTPERVGLLLGAADRARRDTGYFAARPPLPDEPVFAMALDRCRALTLDRAAERALGSATCEPTPNHAAFRSRSRAARWTGARPGSPSTPTPDPRPPTSTPTTTHPANRPSTAKVSGRCVTYLSSLATWPAPTVRPPSR